MRQLDLLVQENNLNPESSDPGSWVVSGVITHPAAFTPGGPRANGCPVRRASSPGTTRLARQKKLQYRLTQPGDDGLTKQRPEGTDGARHRIRRTSPPLPVLVANPKPASTPGTD